MTSTITFIKTIFGADNDNALIASKHKGSDSLGWSVRPFKNIAPNSQNENYVNLSTTEPLPNGIFTRQKKHFKKLYFLILDDIGGKYKAPTGFAPPSYIMQTSIKDGVVNTQWGYILDTPIDDGGLAKALLTAVVQSSESSDNVDDLMRLARIPGMNYKPGKDDDGRDVKLLEWNPNRRFSVDQLLSFVGKTQADLNIKPETDYSFALNANQHPMVLALDAADLLLEDTPNDKGFTSIICPWHDLHTSDTGSPTGIVVNLDGHCLISCFHSSCKADGEDQTFKNDRVLDRIAELNPDGKTPTSISNDIASYKAELDFKDYKVELPEGSAGDQEIYPAVYCEYSDEPLYQEFVIDGFLAGGITVIAGPAGIGKTSALVSMAAITAHLCDALDPLKPELRRKVIYVCEDTNQVQRILATMRQRLGTSKDEFRQWFKVMEARRVFPSRSAKAISQYIDQFSYAHESGYLVKPLIVLDTSNAALELENENDNSQVGAAISKMKTAVSTAPFWLVAHTAKGLRRADVAEWSSRGASAFEADANATAFIFDTEGEENMPSRAMTLGKHRYVASFTEIAFDSVITSETTNTPWGTVQESHVRVSIPKRSSKAERESLLRESKEKRLAEKADSNKENIMTALRNNTDPIAKKDLRDLVKGGTKEFYQSLEDLVLEGRVTSNRQGRTVFLQISDEEKTMIL